MYDILKKAKIALVEGCFCKKCINKIDTVLSRWSRKLFFKRGKIQNNKIIFMTYQNDYACNPKYIAEEIIAQNLQYDLVWVVKDIKKVKSHFPKEIRLVKRNSYAFFHEVTTAKIWIDNSINFFWEDVNKAPNQVLISTWHGSMGLKRVGKEDNKNKKWVEKAKRCDRDTDYCISNSAFETNVYAITHWNGIPVLEYGHPRNDILFNCDMNKINNIKKKVCKELNIEENMKIALYAPTFRDNHNIDCYNIDYDRLRYALKEKFGGEWVVVARHHFHLWSSKIASKSIVNLDGVVRGTDYDDMQELMVAADIGITDYSSWICDFVLTGKPGFIFATDLDEYNNERGLYYPLETTPFSIARNNNELVNNIINFNYEKYKSSMKKFLVDKGCVEDGKASYRVVEKIKEIIGDK